MLDIGGGIASRLGVGVAKCYVALFKGRSWRDHGARVEIFAVIVLGLCQASIVVVVDLMVRVENLTISQVAVGPVT
jgi:hypothetical protein